MKVIASLIILISFSGCVNALMPSVVYPDKYDDGVLAVTSSNIREGDQYFVQMSFENKARVWLRVRVDCGWRFDGEQYRSLDNDTIKFLFVAPKTREAFRDKIPTTDYRLAAYWKCRFEYN